MRGLCVTLCLRTHRLRNLQILCVALVEAIRFKLQGHHVKPVMLGQGCIGGFEDAAGQGPGMDMVGFTNAVLRAQISGYSLKISAL